LTWTLQESINTLPKNGSAKPVVRSTYKGLQKHLIVHENKPDDEKKSGSQIAVFTVFFYNQELI
jgi:hypothetical protein